MVSDYRCGHFTRLASPRLVRLSLVCPSPTVYLSPPPVLSPPAIIDCIEEPNARGFVGLARLAGGFVGTLSPLVMVPVKISSLVVQMVPRRAPCLW
uniref:Uncharacterized protein n=1 Tax=Caenorhabditis japonica TaxID=281687 RepID=A0A8R1IJ91_CAEJA